LVPDILRHYSGPFFKDQYIHGEDETTTLSWNVRNQLRSDIASYLRRMETSLTPLLKPKNLHDTCNMYMSNDKNYKWYEVLSFI